MRFSRNQIIGGIVVLVLIVVIVIAGLVLIVPFISWGDQAQPSVAFWIGFSVFVFVAVCFAFVMATNSGDPK